MECEDFSVFQDALQKMRQIDDKIIYLLNTTIPTESFKSQVDPTAKCKDLYQQIELGHSNRAKAINKCLDVVKGRVKELREQRNPEKEDLELIKKLRKEQSTMRLLQSELNAEEVINKRTAQVYYERCREFYKPKNNKL